MTTPTETFIGALSGLRAWWPMSAADPTNEVVGGLDLTLQGSPSTGIDMGFPAGDTGITFVESTQWAETAHNSAYNAALLDWSFAAWLVLPTSDTTTRYIIGHDGNGDAGTWDVKHTSSNLATRFAGITPGNSAFTPNGNVKFLVCNFDRDGNAVRYLDGSSVHSASIAAGSAVDVSATKKLYIARRETAGYGTLSICHVVLRAALWTPTEISDAMAARLDAGTTPTDTVTSGGLRALSSLRSLAR